MRYLIEDWAGNRIFNGATFASFDDAWNFLMEKFPDAEDDTLGEYFVVPEGN